MNKKSLTLAMLVGLTAMTSTQAGEFDGLFVGGKLGYNSSEITGGSLATGAKASTTWGIDEGYNWDKDSYLLGIDFSVNNNLRADHVAPPESYSSSAIGLGLKLGVTMNSWLPYIHLAYAKTKGGYDASSISGSGVIGGLGLEYKFAPNWSANAELSYGSSAKNNGSSLNNNNATVGIRYYFGYQAEPVISPVVAKKVQPAAAPAPSVSPKSVQAPLVTSSSVAEPTYASQAKVETKPKESWKTILTEHPVRIEGANFPINSAKLLKKADLKLNEVVNAVKLHPDLKLDVIGHTDNRGKKASNQKLSENRAAAVKAWLVKHGVASDSITTVGYADTKPIADNKTLKGRAANRRVEVHYVIKEEKNVKVPE